MTIIREPNFSMDLPGTWEQAESAEPETLLFRKVDAPEQLSVTLLGVRPMFTIADRVTLLDQYVQHRSKFEKGHRPGLEQTTPVAIPAGEDAEGGWDATDAESGRRLRHTVILTGTLLADFCYESDGLPEDEFSSRAEEILRTARAIAP